MKIRVQSIHFDADKKLLQFIEEKVDKLVHFYDHIIGGEVTLKVDKASDNKNKIVQIVIQIPVMTLLPKSNVILSKKRLTFVLKHYRVRSKNTKKDSEEFNLNCKNYNGITLTPF